MNTALFKQGIIAFCFIVISLASTEVLVRVFCPEAIVRAFSKPDNDLGNINRPNQRYYDRVGSKYYTYHVNTNEYGLRMNQPVDVASQRKKIMAVGGSTLFGWGVEIEDSYYDLLRVTAEANTSIQFLNGGNGGYVSGHVLKSLKRFSKMFEYNAVVYFLYAADVRTNARLKDVYTYIRTEEGIDLQEKKVYSPFKEALYANRFYVWLNQHSYLFVKLKQNFISSKPEALLVDLERSDANRSEDDELAIDVTMAFIDQIIKYCESIDVPLALIWVPVPSEFSDTDLDKLFYHKFKDVLKARVTDLETTFFYDPTEVFGERIRTLNTGLNSVYYSEGHLTTLGNRLYAESAEAAVDSFISFVIKE